MLRTALILAGLTTVASVAGAQSGSSRQETQKPPTPIKVEIPRGYSPPPGMCRVWIDRVPAGQQPAPTDCASAIRNRPPNGRVIFSEDQDKKGKGSDRNSLKQTDPKPKKPEGSSDRK